MMPRKERQPGHRASLLDMTPAKAIPRADIEALAQEFEIDDSAELARKLALIAIAFRNAYAMVDDAPAPAVMRDAAGALHKAAVKFEGRSRELDGRTVSALRDLPSEALEAIDADALDRLVEAGLAERPDERGIPGWVDVDAILDGITVLTVLSGRLHDRIAQKTAGASRSQPSPESSDILLARNLLDY